jgi:hypothetical protein
VAEDVPVQALGREPAGATEGNQQVKVLRWILRLLAVAAVLGLLTFAAVSTGYTTIPLYG